MAVTPDDILSLPLLRLQDLIADSAEFQSWVGAVDADAAKESIHFVNIDTQDIARPFAIVYYGRIWKRQIRAVGPGNHFTPNGLLQVSFEDEVAPANAENHADAFFAFANRVGKVISEIEDLSGQGGYLSIHEIRFDDEPVRSDPDEVEGDFYTVSFFVEYGF